MSTRDASRKTEMERVWERLKERAAAYAASDSTVGMDDALAATITICSEECALHQPPADAIEYFARELVNLTQEASTKLGVAG